MGTLSGNISKSSARTWRSRAGRSHLNRGMTSAVTGRHGRCRLCPSTPTASPCGWLQKHRSGDGIVTNVVIVRHPGMTLRQKRQTRSRLWQFVPVEINPTRSLANGCGRCRSARTAAKRFRSRVVRAQHHGAAQATERRWAHSIPTRASVRCHVVEGWRPPRPLDDSGGFCRVTAT